MKRLISLLVCCLMLVGTALAEGSAIPTPGPEQLSQKTQATVLTAVGQGTVSLAPDIAVLTFHLKSTAATVADAQNASMNNAEALYAALESVGVKREDIYNVNYRTATVYSYQYGKLGEGENPSGYSVDNDVMARLRDVKALGMVIDTAMQNGADSSYEMSFESSQAAAAYDHALTLAAADGMRKAELLAKASGLRLGKLLSLRECPDSAASVSVEEDLSDPEEPNSLRYALQVTASVEICYEAE